MAAPFVFPAGWTPFTVPPERAGAYKLTRGGNLEVAIELSRELAGARSEAPTAGLVSSEELAEASQGPVMSFEESRRMPTPGVHQLPLRLEGRPAVKPLTVFTDRGPLPVHPEEYSAEKFLTIYGITREQAAEEVRKVMGPKLKREPPKVLRHEFGVALIPRAAVEAYRQYRSRLPMNRLSRDWYVWGASWSIYLARIDTPTFGFLAKAAGQGALVYESFATFGTGTRQSAFRPSQVTEKVLSDTRGNEFVPVTYYTVAALLRHSQSLELRNPDFDHAMRANEWRVCGRIPRAGNGIFCPTRAPTTFERQEGKPGGLQIPLPFAEAVGEAAPFQPTQRAL